MEKNNGTLYKGIGLILVLILLLALSLVVFNKVKSISLIPDFLKKKEVQIDLGTNIVEEIKMIAEYSTASYFDEVFVQDNKYDFKEKDYRPKTSSLFSNLFSDTQGVEVSTRVKANIAMIISGECKAGFDLSRITTDDIIISGDSITVVLPDPDILDTIINPSDYEVFDNTGSWTDDEITGILIRTRNTIKRDAIKNGLLEDALRNGKKQIKSFLSLCGFSTITVISESEALEKENNSYQLTFPANHG